MAITRAMLERTKRFEGCIEHLYLDSVGAVTIGVGFMIPNAQAAIDYPLVTGASGAPATEEQKKDAWSAIHEAEPGHSAQWYAKLSGVILLPSDIDSLLEQKLGGTEKELTRVFAEWESYPALAKEGLMDMMFNLGRPKFMTFGKFIAAVRAQDWAQAACECSRRGVSADRNNETKELFLAAQK